MAVTTGTASAVAVDPIREEDLAAVAQFLHANLNRRVAPEAWARAVDVPWAVDRPNAGFMLRDGGDIVGAHLAYYSTRTVAGRSERFCNLGAWCVLPSHRFHGLRLLKSLLAQEGYHFTDLSPSGSVVGINTRLGFRFLDTTTALVPNLPWPSRPGRYRVTSDPAALERTLQGTDLELYRDHARTAAARHLLLRHGDDTCYVLFRMDRRKGSPPVFASILHATDPDVLRAMLRPVSRHLLLRHRAIAMLIERQVLDPLPRGVRSVESPRRKMFLSSTLEPATIDYLYSELVCLSW
jgi:hypothetical protein